MCMSENVCETMERGRNRNGTQNRSLWIQELLKFGSQRGYFYQEQNLSLGRGQAVPSLSWKVRLSGNGTLVRYSINKVTSARCRLVYKEDL